MCPLLDLQLVINYEYISLVVFKKLETKLVINYELQKKNLYWGSCSCKEILY